DGAVKLTPQQLPALFGNEAPLGKAQIPDHLLETQAIELAVRPLENGIGGNPLGNLGIGDAEPQRSRPLVERGLGDELADDHTVEAAGARLFHADRLAELAAELVQPLVIELPKLLDSDLGAADLG